ncbi:MAG: glucose-6-phosphate isomerase [Rhodobiaceae bacterium]|nr:glucose-6-phosphate isomerase [Rhodobiaceae bacterium]MCC0054874.1 glucose-6-phosphate isomerase [Rhodobiaceae bacterium]
MRQSIELCLKDHVAGGVSADALNGWLERARPALESLRAKARAGTLPLLALPSRGDDLPAVGEMANWLARCSHAVLLGTGGSSLGGQTLAQAAGWNVAGVVSRGARLSFLDNLDPVSLADALASTPLAETRFLAVSKSGGTGETLIQTMAVLDALKKAGLGDRIADHVRGLSEPVKAGAPNKLRDLLAPYGVSFQEHDPGVGGRFSALTNVGLIPASLAGLDPSRVREGAARALAPVLGGAAPADCPAALGAALSMAAAENGRTISVLWAYADRLERFTRWYVQLWSESLGKGGNGTTPVAAVGPVDQHSQLQLFLDGPADKLVTLIMRDTRGEGPELPADLAVRAGEKGFAGRHVGDFVWAQQRATADTLARNGRPVRTFLLDRIDSLTIGELLMHFMLETIIAADLLGIDAFDQPAVEEGKILAKQYLAED